MKQTAVMTDEQTDWKVHLPESYKKNYEKAVTTNSKTEAIKAKCLDCMAWDKKEVKTCPITYCPLYPHRPYQGKAKNPKKVAKSGQFSTYLIERV